MKRCRSSSWVLGITMAGILGMVVGCGGGGGQGSAGSQGASGNEPTPVNSGVTMFHQNVAAEDGDSEAFPGQANVWDIDEDGSLVDGWDDQFDGALRLYVNGDLYSTDGNYSKLHYFTPLFGSADGVKVAALVSESNGSYSSLSGNDSLLLNTINHAEVSQVIDLSSAAGSLTLNLRYRAYLYSNWSRDNMFKVKIVDLADGNVTEYTILHNTGVWNGTYSKDLSAFAGKEISLSFVVSSDGGDAVMIDDINLTDGNNVNYIQNGDFEGHTIDHWSIKEPSETQNFTIDPQVVGGVKVTRSFFTKPDSLWGRWVDVFENDSNVSVDINVSYKTNLGSDDYGIIYDTPNANGQAITTWDGDASDRDVGMVYGNADEVEYTSDDGLDNGNGSDDIYFRYNGIHIPAHGKVAIVNFVIMDGHDTGQTATDINARATKIDQEVQAIVSGMAARDSQYLEGMTSEQKEAILNF